MANVSRQRIRQEDGAIRMNRGDTLVRDLRKTYGSTFAMGYRSDTRLSKVLKREGYDSLSDYLEKSRSVRTYTAVIHREDPWYVAACPEVGWSAKARALKKQLPSLKKQPSFT